MKARKIQSRAARAPMFSRSRVGSAVAMVLIATGAQAASTTVDNLLQGSVAGVSAGIPDAQTNAGNVGAMVNGATVGTTSTGTPTTPSPMSQITGGNLVSATAMGNSTSATIGALPGPVNPVNDAATLAVGINTGVISSTVQNSTMGLASSVFQSGSVANSDNTISATTTLNSGVSSVSGSASAAAAQAGSATLTYPAGTPVYDAAGNLVVTSVQSASGASSQALVQGNTASLVLTSNVDSAVAGSAALERNAVTAVFKGNTADTTAHIQAGGAPTFAGSVMVANLQANGNGIVAAAHSATNAGTQVYGIVTGVPGAVNALQGTLSVQGNSISSASTGNEALGVPAGTAGTAGTAGNGILIDTLSVAGTGGAGGATANDSTHAGVGVVTHVNSDLAIVNSQGNRGVGFGSLNLAQTSGAAVIASAQSLDGGAIALRDNSITASVTGNTASSAIVAANSNAAASFSATSALSNQQANAGTPQTALVGPSLIWANAGDATNGVQGTMAVSGNRAAATAQGNQATQNLSIGAATVDIGSGAVTLTGGTSADGRVSAAGAATITNLQGNYNGSGVGAINGAPLFTPGSQILLSAAGGGAPIENASLGATANRQEAIAVGNGATQTLALEGGKVGTGAGIASVQMGDASAGVGAGLFNPQVAIVVTDGLGAKSAVALTDNVQRAVSYGNSVSNTASVKATDVAVAASSDVASRVTINPVGSLPFSNTLATQPVVHAAYGVLNDQSVRANVNATATTLAADSYAVGVAGNVTGSSIANDRNAFAAGAFGNDAANGVALETANIGAPGFASVANVTNTQAVGGNGTVISAIAAGGTLERTVITGDVEGASVSASANSAQALAYGSRASANTVSVKGTNIDTSGIVNSGSSVSPALVLTANASFSVQNAQSGQGTVSAERSGGPEVLTQIAGSVRGASVTASGNAAGADATSNSAVNGVAIDAKNIATTTTVQNAQLTSASVRSRLGATSGAQIAVGGALVEGATIAVDNNALATSSTGNEAGNSISVKGTNIDTANGQAFATASSQPGTGASANADHALANTQLVSGLQSIRSTANGVFGVGTAAGAVVDTSTLSVSGNTLRADATGNTATNSVALAATNVSARSALQSTQQSFGQIEATSTMAVFAPAAVSGASAVTLANNRNTAASVINDATNTLSVKADNSTGFFAPAIVLQGVLPGTSVAVGDQLIVNRQSARNAASSTASTRIDNGDGALPVTGLADSSVQVTGNSTLAVATANQAVNANALSGAASQAARLAVLNAQDSTAVVRANAASVAELTLAGGTPFSRASASLSGNSTSGSATGNAATNSVDVKGGAVLGNLLLPIGGALTLPTATAIAIADQTLVNVQTESGGVSSTVTGSTGIHTTAGAAIDASTLSVSNNRQSATAAANTAVNSMSLAGTAVSARSALQSVQTGNAAVKASSDATLFAPAGASASGVSLSGNGNTALGVINDVTNTLKVSATNAQPASTTGSATLVEFLVPGLVLAGADHVVSNRQVASTSVTGSASTTLNNDDNAGGAPSLANGTFSVSGNSTFAEASANRAINTATVAGSATQGASVGVVNSQSSIADATATARTTAAVSLAPAPGGVPLNTGSITLDGNTTAALARGNAATNVVESSAGSSYGAAAALGAGSLAGTPFLALNVGASAAILNSQTNGGAVSASSTGTSYQVALNATGAASGVSSGTVGVTGNTLAAQAVGNSATNRLTQTALNTGTPSAVVGNYQVNTGAVTATVTSVNFGVGVSGAVSSSTLRTTGNQITASATGNSAVSSISAR